MNMIEDDISRYLAVPWCSFPGQKHIFLKYPIPEIPDDFENKSGTDRVLKKTTGSGRVSGTRWALNMGLRDASASKNDIHYMHSFNAAFSLAALTLTAAAFCRASWWVHWLPQSGSSGRMRRANDISVTLTTAAGATEPVVVNLLFVLAVQGSRKSTGLARSGEDWEGADWSWWNKFVMPSQKKVFEVIQEHILWSPTLHHQEAKTKNQRKGWHSPGSTALQLRLQPVITSLRRSLK